jgi:hypothetical protein
MRKKIKKDVIKVLGNIQKLLGSKPSTQQMFRDVQMMKFRVRPIQGDILAFDLNNRKFIETLWSLGKLDEIFQKEYYGLSTKDKEIFMKVFDGVYKKHQEELNNVNLDMHRPASKKSSLIEVEIFKEKLLKKQTN